MAGFGKGGGQGCPGMTTATATKPPTFLMAEERGKARKMGFSKGIS